MSLNISYVKQMKINSLHIHLKLTYILDSFCLDIFDKIKKKPDQDQKTTYQLVEPKK